MAALAALSEARTPQPPGELGAPLPPGAGFAHKEDFACWLCTTARACRSRTSWRFGSEITVRVYRECIVTRICTIKLHVTPEEKILCVALVLEMRQLAEW